MRLLPTIILCVTILGVAVGAIYLLGFFRSEPVAAKPETRPRIVTSLVVKRTSRRIDVTAHGTVTPRTEIDLVAEVPGKVESISDSLQNGGFFAKDEILVQLDARDYELEVTRAKAAVAQAALRVSLEEAEADIAKREWEKIGKGEASSLTLREPQVQEAKAALSSANAVLDKAKLALERTTIRAPFPGRVRVKSVDAGQFVGTAARLARIYSVDVAEVRLPLHDSKLRYLDLPLAFRTGGKNGTRVPVTIRARFAQQMHEWSGEIVRTEGEIDPKSRVVHAIARVLDPYSRQGDRGRPPLSVGMFVEATIHGKTFENVVEIPRSALRSGDEVLVIGEDKRMHEAKVEVLYRGEGTVIVEQGLADGQRVCLSTVGVFVDGMPVEFETKTKATGEAK